MVGILVELSHHLEAAKTELKSVSSDYSIGEFYIMPVSPYFMQRKF